MNAQQDELTLALDTSSTVCGYCLAQGNEYIISGAKRFEGEVPERVGQIIVWLQQMICDYDPDRAIIEVPTGDHQNKRVDRLLSRVTGNVEAVCRLANVQVSWMNPMKVKATGYHKHARQDAAQLVGKNRVGGDEADAIGIWRAWRDQLWEYHLLSKELEEVSDVLRS